MYANNRDRMDHYQAHLKSSLPPQVLSQIQKDYLGIAGGKHVWGVDCEAVLGLRVDMDFTSGGNDGRYKYIPKDELWFDRTYTPSRAAHTLVHEGVEAVLMVKKGLCYNDAHDMANVHEDLVVQALRSGKVAISSYLEALAFVDKWLKAFALYSS
jgi:hypothetical protein